MTTDIYILSGFLGSGKTSLLTQLLQHEKELGRKVGVVMNELGKLSIDSTAVPEDTPLTELLNGCVCCSLSEQFEAQLYGLLQDHQLDVIYIETTGAAHPMEVYDACLSPLFASKVSMKGILSVIDLNQWKQREKLSPAIRQLMVEQIRQADLLLLNKIDLVSEQEQASFLFEIQQFNSHAKTILTQQAQININEVLQIKTQTKGEHTPIHVHNELRLQSLVYTFSDAVERNLFEEFLHSLPETVYRMKGFIRFTSSPTLYSFQYSYGVPLFISDMMNYPLTLVIIGEKLDKNTLEQQLRNIEKNGLGQN
ncbi:CobW family GTP-binding protein [Bacillus alkalicellulosilyticus]|uniref:CobW family GTP-binding protein n=1 Tax=Alkalihalobacterium alkalicellulosilyticum TaxID=1912214 RepID=UPI0009987C3F|nr:GTP-binding protein [Bacillus alkalicellulosilyticus]